MATPMDELASNVLAILHKPSVPSEAKLAQLNSLKSCIKHQRIPESAQYNTAECLRLAIASQTSSSLVAAGFSSLSHLIKRLALQEHMSVIFSSRVGLIPTLVERFGDHKETHRVAASQAFCDIWPSKQIEVEKAIREGPLISGNPRSKLMAMQWVTKMHVEHNLQFKGFVSPMVACLEDADGTVRESAKLNLVELFRGSRDGAKTDLKKQLIAHNVRKSIASYVLSQLGLSTQSEFTHGTTSTYVPPHHPEFPPADAVVADSSHTEPSLPPSVEVAYIEPLHVSTARELEDTFRQMQPSFEDKEKEDNWKARDNNVLKLRRLLKGNAPTDHQMLFVAGVKNLLDGVLKVIHSLRTTVSTNGCQFVQELARALGYAIDPIAEILLHGLEKMCSATKQISAQNGNTTTNVLLTHVSYNIRYVQHIWSAVNDKNVQPRCFASGWLQTILKKAACIRPQFDHSGGLELADRCIRKGLSDPNPKVRESMRGTYWVFVESWPEKAAAIMSSLDAKSQQLLEKDSGNPNAVTLRNDFTRSVGPDASANPRLVTSRSRASLKEQIAAQKKATLAARRMPERPNSAMSSFTPIKDPPSSARRGVPTVPRGMATLAASRQTSNSSQASVTGQGSLMSAPMRRPRKPELPRPATADPYANGRMARDETPPMSPKQLSGGASHAKSKSTSAASVVTSTQSSRVGSSRTSPQMSPAKHKAWNSQSSEKGLSKAAVAARQVLSPPAKIAGAKLDLSTSRGVEGEPSTSQLDAERPSSGHSSTMETMDEDNFTLVIPEKSQIYKPDSTIASSLQSRNVGPTEFQDKHEEPLPVFEDPIEEQHPKTALEDGPPSALEEVNPNEQNLLASQLPTAPLVDLPPPTLEYQERPVSPKKPIESPVKIVDSNPFSPDRPDIIKSRRLLLSGIERVRERSLDAHGFRRLHDLVKTNSQMSDLHFGPLLEVLLNYLQEPNESLKANKSKAIALKSQALSTARAVLSLRAKDLDVYNILPSCLVSFIEAGASCESSASHLFTELEKAVEDVVRRIESDPDQVIKSVDLVSMLAECDSEPSLDASDAGYKQAWQAYARKVGITLSALSKLIDPSVADASNLPSNVSSVDASPHTKSRQAQLAVKFLKSPDPDVRRHAMEFTVVVYGYFSYKADSSGLSSTDPRTTNGSEKDEFWKLLKEIGEQQCNLVAYYIARKEQS